ncbi:hypothetical protein VTK56DRAFT_5545 [Thermocarpiscus australiensis]
MQVLSHFSCHVSGGFYVLCDLQGCIYRHEVVLSDPVILSRTREFGVTDLGPSGISSFFSHHSCNRYCRPHWTAPANPVPHIRPVRSTTMLKHSVPTANSRPMLMTGLVLEVPEEDDSDLDKYHRLPLRTWQMLLQALRRGFHGFPCNMGPELCHTFKRACGMD